MYTNFPVHEIDMASMYVDSGSGFQEAYLSSFLFSLEANKSTSGMPNNSVILSKTCMGIAHSAASLNSLDAWSARVLCFPGM